MICQWFHLAKPDAHLHSCNRAAPPMQQPAHRCREGITQALYAPLVSLQPPYPYLCAVGSCHLTTLYTPLGRQAPSILHSQLVLPLSEVSAALSHALSHLLYSHWPELITPLSHWVTLTLSLRKLLSRVRFKTLNLCVSALPPCPLPSHAADPLTSLCWCTSPPPLPTYPPTLRMCRWHRVP